MEPNLTIQYDSVGDILYIDRIRPYSEQVSDHIGEDVIARFNPMTGEIENLEVLFFSKRLLEKNILELPINAELRPAVRV